ncbi:unnamed protein product [Laminaria digitata]
MILVEYHLRFVLQLPRASAGSLVPTAVTAVRGTYSFYLIAATSLIGQGLRDASWRLQTVAVHENHAQCHQSVGGVSVGICLCDTPPPPPKHLFFRTPSSNSCPILPTQRSQTVAIIVLERKTRTHTRYAARTDSCKAEEYPTRSASSKFKTW